MKLTILGTGNAAVTACYNTCFLLTGGPDHLLVDGGGGNGIFRQLKAAGVRWQDVRSIFVTHKHLDHITGILWMMRMILQGMARGQYEGEAVIYSHKEVTGLLRRMAGLLLSDKETRFLDVRLHLVTVEDGESLPLLGQRAGFFDIGSTKAAQFGFSITLPGGGRLTCCGDEPFNERERPYAQGSRWLLHEAFCPEREADVFKPHQKHHSTVADACRLAQELGVENLILYHTEDRNIARRKALYTAEGAPLFSGRLFVPEDLETFEL
ncbi:MBL fold metallo-hydrolase [Candidatus Allofournierella excrementigallinarum]|uniref:MBL fold metallo-hydrolase n=1 Tax=Candidatus Allofournierella excrementigallinarum TaxID=2838592 RepID=UPI00374E2A5B